MDGNNVYKYVRNNSLNIKDPWGYKPGDKYYSQDDAAVDAMNDVNDRSIKEIKNMGDGYIKIAMELILILPQIKGLQQA